MAIIDGKAHEMGLSERGFSNIADIMPRINAAVQERANEKSPCIDLATSENWLIREELVRLCKDSILQNLKAAVPISLKEELGTPELLDALANFFNSYFNPKICVESSHLVTGPGASGCIDALLYNICNPEDGILLPGPYWSGFDLGLRVRSSVNPVLVSLPDLKSNFTEALIPAMERAFRNSDHPIKALMLCNPHNPLAVCYPRPLLESCIRFCAKHNIHFISDEVYAMTSFKHSDLSDPVPFTSTLSLDILGLGGDLSRVHTIWSTSKDFGQSGLRMGCIATQSNKKLVVALALATFPQTSQLTTIFVTQLLRSEQLPSLMALNSQRLGEAYTSLTTWLSKFKIPYIPCNAGLYVFAKIAPNAQSWEEESDTIIKLKTAGVLVSAGKSYHVPEVEKGWARIGFALEKSALEEALQRMASVFTNWSPPSETAKG